MGRVSQFPSDAEPGILAFLLVPIPREKLHRIRHWIAIPLGFALFWHDTWLPGPESIFSQGSQIAGFSASYIWDLIVRFINWSMVGAFFVLLVLWLFISQWLRVTVFVSAMVVWLAVSLLLPAFTLSALRSAHHGRRHDRTGQYRGQRRRWRRVQPRQQRYSAADRAADLSQPDQLAERFLCRRAEAQDAVPRTSCRRMRSRLTCW